jgi:hypothetical protein
MCLRRVRVRAAVTEPRIGDVRGNAAVSIFAADRRVSSS